MNETNIHNRAVKNKNKGKYRTQKNYRKIQDSYKNTGIYRIYRTGGSTAINSETKPVGLPDKKLVTAKFFLAFISKFLH